MNRSAPLWALFISSILSIIIAVVVASYVSKKFPIHTD